MSTYRGIIKSEHVETVALFQKISEEMDMILTIEQKIANFLFDLFENGYQVAIIDFNQVESECLKWVQVIRRIRPKIPLIVLCDQVDFDLEARMHQEKIFYLGHRPVDKQILSTVCKSALKGAGYAC